MGRKSTFNDKDAAEIYGLIDPRDGALRYIGKASDSAKRLRSHLRDARRRRAPVYDWINKLAAINAQPSVVVLEVVSRSVWPAAERRHIADALAAGHRLLNVAPGGEEPFCAPEVRRANAKALNLRLSLDPVAKMVWSQKRAVADGLRRGFVSNAARAKLREAAALAPSMFGTWASIPDRLEAPDGSAL